VDYTSTNTINHVYHAGQTTRDSNHAMTQIRVDNAEPDAPIGVDRRASSIGAGIGDEHVASTEPLQRCAQLRIETLALTYVTHERSHFLSIVTRWPFVIVLVSMNYITASRQLAACKHACVASSNAASPRANKATS
jgi:hypothetical protein